MQYLGGKSKLAKEISAVIAPKGVWWEPFCGGQSVSVQLAKYGPGICTDVNPALIALYQAVQDGWQPPSTLSEAEWRAAKTLPDSDPIKAFAGFGCSFGGKWFGGYARGGGQNYAAGTGQNYAAGTGRTLLRDALALKDCLLGCLSFLEVDPETTSPPEVIYCDPPYAGTTGYKGTAPFNHELFWDLCQIWATLGVRVFVSEYACPRPATVVWEKRHATTVGTGAARASSENGRLERLFLVSPIR